MTVFIISIFINLIYINYLPGPLTLLICCLLFNITYSTDLSTSGMTFHAFNMKIVFISEFILLKSMEKSLKIVTINSKYQCRNNIH